MFTQIMVVTNKTQMAVRQDTRIIVSNGQQLPVTSAGKPLMKFIHLNTD